MELKAIEKKVLNILENFPETRDDDKVLYYKYLDIYGYDTKIKLEDYLFNSKYPKYDSVSRCRRRVQSKRPDLLGTKTRQRKECEKEYIEYAKSS